MKLKINQLTYILISIFVIAFLFFLISSAYFVKPCSDDLWFYYKFTQKGWFNSINEFKYNQRWVSYLVFNTICLLTKSFQELHKAYFLYYLFIFSFLLFSTARLFKKSIDLFLL